MFKIAIGHSDEVDEGRAIEEVIRECEAALQGEKPQAGVLFAGIDFDHKRLLEKISEAYPGLLLTGCSSNAELSPKYGVVEDSVLLTLFASDQIEFSVGLGQGLSGDPKKVTQQAVDQAKASLTGEPKLCFSHFDTLTSSGLGVPQGLNLAMGNQVPVLGGAAADQFQIEHTYQFFGDQVLEDSVVVLLLSGDLLFSYGVSSGRQTTGEKYLLGKIEGSRIYEIGGMRAVDFYHKYLGDVDQEITKFPLAIFEGSDENFFLRTPMSTYEDGSIGFVADIPNGSQARLTQSSRLEILEGAEQAYKKALDAYPGKNPQMIKVTSCAGRKVALGTKVKEEFSILSRASAGKLPIFGFYSFGEMCPLLPGDGSKLHNETIVVCLVGET